MRVLLATLGSGGDVHPYIALAVALRERGHEAWLLTSPYFQARAEAAGVAFIAQGTSEEYLEAVTHPDLVDRRRGPGFVVNTLVVGKAREMLVAARKAIRAHRIDVVVRHLIAFGAGWAAEREGVRQVSCTLSPMFWLSVHDHAVYKPWEPAWYPPFVRRARLRMARRMARRLFNPAINAARAEAGLPPLADAFLSETTGGERSLGLWSPVFRPAMPDDPAHGRICGFTWFDGASGGLSATLERFLERGGGGDAPIVFTLGTSVVHHAGGFFEVAAEACRRLKRRGVLLTGPDGAEGEVTPGVLAVRYAPFGALLHRAAAVVHHGGVGTTAQALRAGRPQVVIPWANDEFDNAQRVRRLGSGVTRSTTWLSGRRLAGGLARALGDAAIAARAAEVGARLQREDGAAAAAEEIESLMLTPARAERGIPASRP